MRPETIEFLEENLGSKFLTSLSNFFLDMSPWARETKENKQMGLHQTKKFCAAKETINKMKRQPTEWVNIFINDTSDEELISKIYKDLMQVKIQKQ